jgi:hypothetical protein
MKKRLFAGTSRIVSSIFLSGTFTDIAGPRSSGRQVKSLSPVMTLNRELADEADLHCPVFDLMANTVPVTRELATA